GMRKKIRMDDKTTSLLPDSTATYERFQHWTRLMGRVQQVLLEFWVRQGGSSRPLPPDPFSLMPLGAKVMAGLTANPQTLADRQAALTSGLMDLWKQAAPEFEAARPD